MKSILFSTEMVRAIQEGRKTVTRRRISLSYDGHTPRRAPYEEGDILWVRESWDFQPCVTCAFRDSDCGADPAERRTAAEIIEGCYLYRADCDDAEIAEERRWRPSIHMPRQAARIFLRVQSVTPKSLQASINKAPVPMLELYSEGIPIYEECEECLAYGSPCCSDGESECRNLDQPRWEFSALWDKLVPKHKLAGLGWAADPWVWVIRFERCERPDGWPK
jgi:hypothetical protein